MNVTNLSEAIIFSTQDGSNEQSLVSRLHCFGFDNSPGSKYLALTLHASICVFALAFAYVSIFKYYLNSSIVKSLKMISLFGCIIWLINIISWLINWCFGAFNCTNPAHWLLFTLSFYTVCITNFIGYFTIIICFFMRLIKSFDNSMFEISIYKQKLITILIITSCMLAILSILCFIINIFIIGYILFAFGLIIYIVISILILKLMINQMFQFISLFNSNDNDIEMKINQNQDKMKNETFELIVKLIVLYSISLFSTLIIILFQIFLAILVRNEYYSIGNIVNIYICRLIYISEAIINCICLLFQNKIAIKLYNKYCVVCHSLFKKYYMKRLHV